MFLSQCSFCFLFPECVDMFIQLCLEKSSVSCLRLCLLCFCPPDELLARWIFRLFSTCVESIISMSSVLTQLAPQCRHHHDASNLFLPLNSIHWINLSSATRLERSTSRTGEAAGGDIGITKRLFFCFELVKAPQRNLPRSYENLYSDNVFCL